jgi:DNA-binding transcriptional ArsR family regulator
MNDQEGTSRHHHHPLRAFPAPPRGPAIEDASAMFRALGDASRLRLLTRLVAGEICVTELADLEEEKLRGGPCQSYEPFRSGIGSIFDPLRHREVEMEPK